MITIKYKIIAAESLGYLEESVNDHIKKGWIPQGGVCVVNNDNDHPNKVCQALIFKEECRRISKYPD